MKEYKYAVFIGRFQPLHNAHLTVINHGFSIADKLILVLGSVNSPSTIKNPFTFEERKQMILDSISRDKIKDIIVIGVRDYYYSDNIWISDIQSKTDQYIAEGDSVALIGDYKDSSSYYLKCFPQWDFKPVNSKKFLNATEIRDFLFKEVPTTSWADRGVTVNNPPELKDISDIVTVGVLNFLVEFVKTERFVSLCQEFKHIQNYKDSWSNTPYPVTFVTADSVVLCSGHVLVVKRKFSPGKGLYALPGGFVRQDERLEDCAVRELKEETGIRVDKIILSANIVDSKVFDFPERSLRGRTITHAYCIKLKDGKLPEVRGNDDADSAFWLPFMDVTKHEDKFFEDHVNIIQYFISRD